MTISRPWAFWRQVTYFGSFGAIMLLVCVGVYLNYFYQAAGCFDGKHNGSERGIDCGGACIRVCAFDVAAPKIEWARSFEIIDNQYNALAYIANTNESVGTPELKYTFSLFDAEGLITERSGTTVLPPNSVYPIFEGRINTGGRTPTNTFIDIEPPEVWQPVESGRELFTVGAADLQDEGTSPRLIAAITNEDLFPVEDVEVVATIFDSKRNALTASRTVVPNFAGRGTQDIVFTWPLPIAGTLRSCNVPTDVLVAIDLSGSMNDQGGVPPEPISSVKSAAMAFVDRLRADDQAGVVTFATNAEVHTPLSGDTAAVSQAIASLSIPPAEEAGFTNSGEAFIKAAEAFSAPEHNTDARKMLVLLTDGLTNAPEEDPEVFAFLRALELRQTDVSIFTIGLGEKVNTEFLRSVASTPQQSFQALSIADVDQIYQTITGSICEDGPSVIEIIPKTGARFVPLGQ